MISSLIDLRREVHGKRILTNTIIDDLVDEGILSYQEGESLKKVKYGVKGIKFGSGGRRSKSGLTKTEAKQLASLFKRQSEEARKLIQKSAKTSIPASTFKPFTYKAPKFSYPSLSKVSTAKLAPKLDLKELIGATTVKRPKAAPSYAKAVSELFKGVGQGGGKKLKLSRSYYRKAR